MSVITRQRYIERHRVRVPYSIALMVQAAATLLEEKRTVVHTQSDALGVAMNAVMSATPTHVKMLAKFYVDPGEEVVVIRVRPEVKRRVFEHAKHFDVSAKALIYAVMTVFLRAALAGFWQNNRKDFHEIRSKFPDFIFAKRHDVLNLPKVKEPTVKLKKVRQGKDETQMRHHNYMDDFKSFMQQYGGIEKYLNKNVTLSIYTRPLPGNVNRSTPEDVSAEDGNEYAKFWVRIWKRGRGYNLTVHGSEATPEQEEGPRLEIGTVFRLYEIYRNIDWSTIHIKE